MKTREQREKVKKMKKKRRESWQNGSCQLWGLSQFQDFTKICAVGTHTQTICLTESLNVSDSSIPRFFAPFIARFAQLLGDDSFARCRFNSLFVTRAFFSFPFLLGGLLSRNFGLSFTRHSWCLRAEETFRERSNSWRMRFFARMFRDNAWKA